MIKIFGLLNTVITFLSLLATSSYPQTPIIPMDEEYISINQIKHWFNNYNYGLKGGYWPKYKDKIFGVFDGLVWGGILNGDTVSTRTLMAGYDCRPGKILDNGLPDDPFKKDIEYIRSEKAGKHSLLDRKEINLKKIIMNGL